jgi:hypothetical protein
MRAPREGNFTSNTHQATNVDTRVAVVEFRLATLLEFLTVMDSNGPAVLYQMKCMYSGEPPVAEMDQGPFAQAGFRVELSLELASLFVKFQREEADRRIPVYNA